MIKSAIFYFVYCVVASTAASLYTYYMIGG